MPGPSVRLSCLRVTVVLAALSGLLALAAPARAQRSDEDWLDRCRSENDHNGGNDRAHACEVRHDALQPRGTVVVDGGHNGGADVTAWDRDSIAISARIRARASTEEDARDLAKQVRIVTEGGRIHAEGPANDDDARWYVNFVVMVPRRTDVELTAHNGGVAIRGTMGRARLETENGPVLVANAGGDVTARTRNGPLMVELSGDTWQGRGLDAETHNGPVVIRIPDGYSAHLETGTRNGPMSVGFPITVQGQVGRSISTELGHGGAPIRAMTVNGPVRIERPGTRRDDRDR